MAVFHGHDDAVERRKFALELEPRLAAPARRVRRIRALEDQPFVTARARGFEPVADSSREGAGFQRRPRRNCDGRTIRHDAFGEPAAPLGKRQVEQKLVLRGENVEDDEAHRNIPLQSFGDVLALQAALQKTERQHPILAHGHDLAVECARARNSPERRDHLGKGRRHVVEGAREDRYAARRHVSLRSYAVVFVFNEPRRLSQLVVTGFECDR